MAKKWPSMFFFPNPQAAQLLDNQEVRPSGLEPETF
jgi:hypothetical protein